MTKEHYLLGWEPEFITNDEKDIYFQTHITDAETAKNNCHMYLSYLPNGKLNHAHDYTAYYKKTEAITINTEVIYKEYPINYLYHFIKDNQGKHSIGGDAPMEFTLPKSKNPFTYIGKISHKTEPFTWLPFDLHLTTSILSDVQEVFLDYSDPLNPTILNQQGVDDAYDTFELGSDVTLTYEAVYFNVKKATEFVDDSDYDIDSVSYAGIPEWVQNPYFPKCPKTGKHLRFVCQLASYQTKLLTTNISKDHYFFDSFRELDFWGAGCLYVFFSPESKVACFFIQNT